MWGFFLMKTLMRLKVCHVGSEKLVSRSSLVQVWYSSCSTAPALTKDVISTEWYHAPSSVLRNFVPSTSCADKSEAEQSVRAVVVIINLRSIWISFSSLGLKCGLGLWGRAIVLAELPSSDTCSDKDGGDGCPYCCETKPDEEWQKCDG